MSAWDESCDFLVIGSGAASVIAALVAKQAGRRPLVLEKTELLGGSTALSGGVLWVPNSPVILRAGVPDSESAARTYLDACVGDVGPASSRARRDTFLREGPRAVAFLESLGMKFMHAAGYADYHEGELPGGLAQGRSIVAPIFDMRELGDWAPRMRRRVGAPPIGMQETAPLTLNGATWHSRVTMLRVGMRMIRQRLGQDLVGMGAALQGRLMQIARREGLDFRTQAAVESFVVEGGRVAGVVARVGGRALRIEARGGVLVNAGGFARNLELRQRYQRAPASVDWTNANPGDTGEMIEQVVGLGAATALLDVSWWVPVSLMPNGMRAIHVVDMAKPHSMLVDSGGSRYLNESTSYTKIGNTIYERNRTVPAVPSWLIMDRRFRHSYRWGGLPPGPPPREWLDSGYMLEAGDLESLARKCSIDPAALRASVERFNGFARDGRDQDFGRGGSAYNRFFGDPRAQPNPNLGTIEQAPFYAVRIYPGDVGTGGGLLTDEHARVLRGDGTPIDGLYATGNSTASIFGYAYPGAGASIAGSAVFGWAAARHALRVAG